MNQTQIDQAMSKIKNIEREIKEILEIMKTKGNFKIGYPTKEKWPITQKFGENPQIYESLGYKGHFGIDWAVNYGTEIIACDDGIVEEVNYTQGNGYFVKLKHTWGESIYMHMSKPSRLVQKQEIYKGQMIGNVGNTGFVLPKPTKERPLAGTHLHFSIKVNGMENANFKDFINPLLFFEN